MSKITFHDIIPNHGGIAQLGEHLLDKQGVTGSSPAVSIRDATIPIFGDIAQLGERLHGMQEAVGSSPIISII